MIRSRLNPARVEEKHRTRLYHLPTDPGQEKDLTEAQPEELLRMAWENVHFEPAGNAGFGYIHNPYGK